MKDMPPSGRAPPLAGGIEGVSGVRHGTEEGPLKLSCHCWRGYFSFSDEEGFLKPLALFLSGKK